jgi:hypothetical protein
METSDLILNMSGCGMEDRRYKVISGKVFFHESGSNVYKYVCEYNDIDKWKAWAGFVGAEKATVGDMLSIGDDEPDCETGLAETEDEDEITFVDVDGEELDSGLEPHGSLGTI